ncbi:uncharacterized protein LY89DRAFT_783800 [Mollisia scopiformis]|uniref:2EXR domain-containing protein n=1 Tax=Mollisia scopiformis TaxID=149040 RepID=A0A194X3D3_MOLSC|nr:uncharacterized protein LY89DRAFT_783800 [Mollisia scopiformis]KUJ14710.1 hypothetical protein LY89DRAFT_783800 [Mollisia scopiformis]
MSSEVSSQASFLFFRQLPPEVRCMIWTLLSMTEPRVVPILYQSDTTSYTARIRPPAVLQTNRECRHEALKIYHELRLGLRSNIGCYINPLTDSVYLRSNLNRASNRIDDLTVIEPWQRGRLITTSPAGDTSLGSTQSTQTEQGNTVGASSSSDVEGNTNPGMLRSRRHSKIMLDDLIHSPDAEIIFKSFHINFVTWDLMRRYYRHRRHKIPVHIKELCVVFEKGSLPLKIDFTLKEIQHIDAFPEEAPLQLETVEEKRTAWNLIRSLKKSNIFVNLRDRRSGRPIALNFPVYAKALDLGESSEWQELLSETGRVACNEPF